MPATPFSSHIITNPGFLVSDCFEEVVILDHYSLSCRELGYWAQEHSGFQVSFCYPVSLAHETRIIRQEEAEMDVLTVTIQHYLYQ